MSAAPMAQAGRVSQLERVERLIVEHLRKGLPNDVCVDLQPDEPARYDTSGKGRIALVHFSAGQGAALGAAKLASRVTFAVICLAQSLRGATSGYLLVEDVEAAMAGAILPGAREFRVLRSRLLDQGGGWWRWAVEVETELVRGRPAAAPTGPFIERFEEKS